MEGKEHELIISLDDAKDNQENYYTGDNVSNNGGNNGNGRWEPREYQYRKHYSYHQHHNNYRRGGHNPHYHHYYNNGGNNGRWDRDYYPRRNYQNPRYFNNNNRQAGGQNPNNHHHHSQQNDNNGDSNPGPPQENGYSSAGGYYSYPPEGQGHQHQLNVSAGETGNPGGSHNNSFEQFQPPNNRFFNHRRGGGDVPSVDVLSPQNQIPPYSHFFHSSHDHPHLPHGQVFSPAPHFMFPELQIPPAPAPADAGKPTITLTTDTQRVWTYDPDAMEENCLPPPPMALSPRSIQNNQGNSNYPTQEKRGSGQFDNRTSPGAHQPFFRRPYTGYGRPYHFYNRWHWNQPLESEDLLTRFHYVDESEKPDNLAPPGDEFEQLSEQVWTKFQTNQQTRETFMRKLELWRDLTDCVRKYNSDYRLEMVGSTISGFGSNTSDVDMCLIINHRNEIVPDPRREAIDLLEAMGPLFETIPHLTRKELILAKVPILKLRETLHEIDVDINVNNSVGMQNSLLLHSYALCDWRVRPLVIVVKLWAQSQGINDAKAMTLSSYSLSLMVIHFLQHGVSPHILPCLQVAYPDRYAQLVELWRVKKTLSTSITAVVTMDNTQSLGELFLGFLEYYSVKFDYRSSAICVRNGSTMSIRICSGSRAPKNDTYQWKHICIEEPFELTNTARSVYDKESFDRIRGVFVSSWQRLLVSHDLETIFHSISPLEARCIGARAKQQQQ